MVRSGEERSTSPELCSRAGSAVSIAADGNEGRRIMCALTEKIIDHDEAVKASSIQWPSAIGCDELEYLEQHFSVEANGKMTFRWCVISIRW